MSYGFYVYYRVSQDAAQALRGRVKNMQATLVESTGIRGRVVTKADEPLLWMEIYEGVADRAAFTQQLEQALATHAIAALLPLSARKTEIFAE